MPKTIEIENTAQGYLELLRDRGIKYFFGNAGTDFASLIDAFARFAAEGKRSPAPVTVPHEFVAVSMAHGYYLVTGEPQVVMVHVIVGTANASAAIMNAARSNVPILFSAGRTPFTETGHAGSRSAEIHWAQESFDQGGLLREFVKWDYELKTFSQLESVVDRALAVTMSEPRGPVYLSLPREVLAEKHSQISITTGGTQSPAPAGCPQPAAIRDTADLLVAAQRPVIITAGLGRDPQAVAALIELAETAALPVVVGMNNLHMNFPTDHPLHLGFDPAPFVEDADLILVVDSNVPWIPAEVAPERDAKVVQIGPDPLCTRYPLRGYRSDITIAAEARAALRDLTRELQHDRERLQSAAEQRFEKLRQQHRRQRRAWEQQAEAVRADRPIDPVWLSACIGGILDPETILINEADLAFSQVAMQRPGSYFGASSASGLGWGLGAALGAKLAAPEKTVIATVGDGSYLFGVPSACHFVSRAKALPILVVIFNNQCWNAVRRATRQLHPEGWAVKTNNFPLSDLEPAPDYELICQANGGYGERVVDPRQVLPALERGLQVVRDEQRQAVINVVCSHPAIQAQNHA